MVGTEHGHIPPGEKQNHLQQCFGMGYVSSQEDTLPETNSSPLKTDFFNVKFPIGKAYFQGLWLLVSGRIHPQSLTWKLKISPWKTKFLLQTIIFRFHGKL